ncbi:hypothetical protein Syun_030533 [Stephania yunnanensis]|uniref:Uncharacterized protein n=1 Tax=Stephania yunnanensis TaxID=152371 RepID=A0AAP0DXD3_9MAGN
MAHLVHTASSMSSSRVLGRRRLTSSSCTQEKLPPDSLSLSAVSVVMKLVMLLQVKHRDFASTRLSFAISFTAFFAFISNSSEGTLSLMLLKMASGSRSIKLCNISTNNCSIGS